MKVEFTQGFLDDLKYLGSWRNKVRSFFINIKLAVKRYYQRGRYGYSQEDLWDFDSFLNEMIPRAVRQFFKESDEFIDHLSRGDFRKDMEEMIRLFEEKDPTDESRNEEWEEEKEKEGGLLDLQNRYNENKKRAFELLGKHSGSLWW